MPTNKKEYNREYQRYYRNRHKYLDFNDYLIQTKTSIESPNKENSLHKDKENKVKNKEFKEQIFKYQVINNPKFSYKEIQEVFEIWSYLNIKRLLTKEKRDLLLQFLLKANEV